MNYIRIDNFDTANSKGIAVVLWVSHCPHHCAGCHNPQTWSEESGKLFDAKAAQDFFGAIENPHIQNVVFSGGDPLSDFNVEVVNGLMKDIKALYPQKKIIVYTGYTIEEILQNTLRRQAIRNVDYLIDGRFEKDNKVKGLDLRGSYNQRCLMMQAGASKGLKLIDWSWEYFRDTTTRDKLNFGKKIVI